MARKTKNRDQVSAYVDLDTKKQIEAIAERERRSVSDTLYIVIEKWLKDGGSLPRIVS
jgi:hypothetical protein